MDIDKFHLKDRLEQIGQSFIRKGWITVYQGGTTDPGDSALVYAYLINRSLLKKALKTSSWDLEPGREGKPAIISQSKGGKWVSSYHSFSDKGIEPLLFDKFFSHNKERYFDISEDFVNYYKLYEKVKSKQERQYFYFDDMGEMEEVIIIQPEEIRFKWKFLLEFISIRKMCLSIGFDFMRLQNGESAEIGDYIKDEDTVDATNNYNHLIRPWGGIGKLNLQSWIHGKTLVLDDPEKARSYFNKLDDEIFESFMTGYDDRGDLIYTSCDGEDKGLVLTFFKKDVLDKYYHDPKRYKVDSFGISCDYFSLKIDNSVMAYVPVFVHYLRTLPHKEQLHWKHYNMEPKEGMGMSKRYYQVMVEGNWSTAPSTPDFYFKEEYRKFNKKWVEKYGWTFYKELNGLDEYQFQALHIPTSNNIKSFCDQIMSLIKITIDGINEEHLVKELSLEPNDKGLTKLEKYLDHHGYTIPDMMQFLRQLQALRSGLIAHRFSLSNKTTKKALEFFDLREDNYQQVAADIFVKSVWTIRALQSKFLNSKNDKVD